MMETVVKRIVLTGMGHWFPSTVLANQFYENLDIGSASDWIADRVGILERRSVLSHEDIVALRRGEISRAQLQADGRILSMGEMAVEPWKMALERTESSGSGSLEPDLVISGSSVPDWDIPANACAIAHKLKIECAGFDVNSACSSFAVNLHVARALMQGGMHRTTAIFNIERYTTRIDFRDRASCVLFGDSAAAAILTTVDKASRKSRLPLGGLELIDTVVHSSPAGAPHVRLPEGDVFSQNGSAVQKFAVTKTVAVAREIMERNGLSASDVQYFIGHQANKRMLASAADKLGFTPEQHLYNVDYYGNQGGSGAPTVLSMHWDKFRSDDYIVVAVVGSGLTWGAALFRKI
jgi:3-oxoacyl-[acyl-carrier-protein] synthase-3